ncbi:hypothetical protein AGMMS50276_04620 [Synergistales bacterium]|nr:hypothetical protein AGMMS50276_04620 [Synergistales bacterium]
MKKYIDEYLPVALLYALSAYFWFDVADFTESSLMYPRGLVAILLVLTTLLLVCTLLKKVKLPKSKDENVPFKFGVIFVSSVIYVFIVSFFGFVVSSLIYVPLTAFLLGYKRKGLAICVSVAAVALVYISFKTLLKVPLPTITLFGITI